VVAPPSAQSSPWLKRFGEYSDAFASGWMMIRGARRQRSVDQGFVLSDHADWPSLQRAIESTGARRILVTHGFTETMVRWLTERGYDAHAIKTEFEGEAGAEGDPLPGPLPGEREHLLIDELAAYVILRKLGIPHSPAEELRERPTISYPLAVKVLSADIPHKTDVGGVILGVKDANELDAAAAKIRSATKCDRIMVQSMARGLGEALVGYRVDAQVGPIVMLAAGGVLTEIYRDRAIRLAPVEIEAAREMVGEVKAFKALEGYRGRPKGDLEALAQAVVALSRLALEEEAFVSEAELNPVMVLEQGRGVVAVDALVRVAR
jgi:hypothetical protein